MTNGEILEVFSNLNKMRKGDEQTLPAKVSFAIVRNCRKLLPIVQDYQDAKVKLIKDNGGVEKEDEPGVFSIDTEDKEKIKKINDELEDLLQTDNADVKIVKIKVSDLKDVNISLEDMNYLYCIIDEEEEE